MKRFHTNKLRYYLKFMISELVPSSYFRREYKSLRKELYKPDIDNLEARISYYNQLNNYFDTNNGKVISALKIKDAGSSYYIDFKEIIRVFDRNNKYHHLFGDVIHIPDKPTFVKSRPIGKNNHNSILLKLNKMRHFKFVNDQIPFNKKSNLAIFRGGISPSKVKRWQFVEKNFNKRLCDIGNTSSKYKNTKYYKKPTPIHKQLTNKFIISVEGIDVATNLKWIMSSNSLCLMTKPTFETWFMEGILIPDYHYVLIKDDYSDLEEKISYYIDNESEAIEIITNANNYTKQFSNLKQEKLIQLLVAEKYFRFSNQIIPERIC